MSFLPIVILAIMGIYDSFSYNEQVHRDAHDSIPRARVERERKNSGDMHGDKSIILCSLLRTVSNHIFFIEMISLSSMLLLKLIFRASLISFLCLM